MSDIITIIICTRDRPVLLQQCLESLRDQVDERVEILVVDSAPSTAETKIVATRAGVRYAVSKRPGLNIARNLGLRLARGETIAFIDDDAVAGEGWIVALREALADSSIACVTGRVAPFELRTPAQHYFEEHFSFDRGLETVRFTAEDDRPWFPVYPAHLGTGCNMAFRREVFDRIGPFDEALDVGTPTGGGGDIDIFRRLLLAGFTAQYSPEALVYHQHRADLAAARRQFWGYGKTFTALLTKSMLLERQLASASFLLFLYRFWQQGFWFVRRLLTGKGWPLHLIAIETIGHLIGPLVFLFSMKRVQRDRLHHMTPVQITILDLDRPLPKAIDVYRNQDCYLLVRRRGQLREGFLIENPGPQIQQNRLVKLISRMDDPSLDLGSPEIPLPSASIVVCTRNRPHLLRSCLQSLRHLHLINDISYEIIVVDNGSGPETACVASEFGVRLVREEQKGLCRARNRGLVEAQGEIVAFLDDDTVIDPDWLRRLIQSFVEPNVASAIGLVLPFELRTPAQRIFESLGGLGRGFERRLFQGALPDTPVGDIGVGANMAFRRSVLLKYGGFKEALDVGTPAHAGGDVDMFYRLLKGGESILYEPAALVWHRHRESLLSLQTMRYRYSVGAGAAFGRWMFHGDLAVVPLAFDWLVNYHLREWFRSLLGLHLLPPGAIFGGFLGAIFGPFAYAHSRWGIRRRRPIETSFQSRDEDDWPGPPKSKTMPRPETEPFSLQG